MPKAERRYRVINERGNEVFTKSPGLFAGWNGGRPDRKIYGRLDCMSGSAMKKENRVFFSSRQAALNAGYRACKRCKP